MSELLEQLTDINPSVPDALFRRLLRDDELGYLRESDNSIIGFEVDLENSVPLSGFAKIGIQKHTILAYRSDLHEPKKLILFPSMNKLFNDSYGLLGLTVIKTEYSSDSFKGKVLDRGLLQDVIADLTPPAKQVELPQGLTDAIVEAMIDAGNSLNKETRRTRLSDPVTSTAISNEPETIPTQDMEDIPSVFMDDDPVFFDEFSTDTADNPVFMDEYSNEPATETTGIEITGPVSEEFITDEHESISEEALAFDFRAIQLLNTKFTNVTEVSNKAIRLGVPEAIANQIIVKVLESVDDPISRIEFARQLFVRVFNEKLYGL
ncbi:MAG: hypothetical protein D8H99_72615 [Streptococcus sp.]|nr:MAG: hypothetical protein D8H99_72615 [Streptococcus sp.]